MALRWSYGGSGPIRPAAAGPAAAEHEQRPSHSSRLGTGTLACPACDAPVAPGPLALSPTDRLDCPFCATTGVVRDFLSLSAPSRPARVAVRVVLRPQRAAR